MQRCVPRHKVPSRDPARARVPGLPSRLPASSDDAGSARRSNRYPTGDDQQVRAQPPLDVLEKVDRALSKPAGHVLRLAGYVDDDVDLETAILTSSLHPMDQQTMLVLLRGLRARPRAD